MSQKKLVGLEQQIIDEYQSGISGNFLSIKHCVSKSTLFGMLKRCGIDRRTQHEAKMKYPYDETFFDMIDTEDKAYFLGLMYADGCNMERDNRVSLGLNDYELIFKFRTAVKSNHPIREINYGSAISYSITMFGTKMSKSLAEKGCGSRKTFTLVFPDESILPPNLINHFIRGYFDGDGCIHNRKNSLNKVVHICGAEEFLLGMANRIPVNSYVRQRHNNKIWFLGIYKLKDVNAFGEWLYKDSSIWLERKKVKFTQDGFFVL